MTISEIAALEGARQDSSTWNVVHLLKENDFYRAHDWSAWLLTQFPMGVAIEKPMKVIAKKMKDGYVDAWCGFPASSLNKFIPNDGTTTFNPVSDTQIDVAIELPAEIGEVSYDALNEKKEAWKNSLPLTEGKKQRREEREIQEQAPRFTRMTDVLAYIVSLRIEELSPMGAYDVLRNLRREVAAMF